MIPIVVKASSISGSDALSNSKDSSSVIDNLLKSKSDIAYRWAKFHFRVVFGQDS